MNVGKASDRLGLKIVDDFNQRTGPTWTFGCVTQEYLYSRPAVMGRSLVIVESPTKAKTIEKFLGKDFDVRASYGHIRDLPNNASEIPESVKKEKWSRLGINIEAGFEPLYIIPADKKKRVDELKKLLKDADELYLATDEDREGESISAHLVEVLKPKVPVKRMVFHEITKQAIQEALLSPRQIDQNLVRAQETRRVIDRLYGYSVSPLLWKKMAPRLSAGRVQSVALRLLVERERERIVFRSASYWDLKATFCKTAQKGITDFEAELTQLGGKRIASGKDFDPTTGKLSAPDEVVLLNEKDARALRERLAAAVPAVKSIEEKPFTTRPYPPFTTSTLQQEASRKLSFAARRTMQVAQTLYENGFITYMRTDSTTLSEEALKAARSFIQRDYGAPYLHPEPRIYKTKVKNAQEAHEAIRPAGAEFTNPEVVRERLGVEAFRLYDLIWKRTVASQMTDARGTRVVVQLELGDAQFRASGKTIEFPGYLRAYVEGSDDPESELADQEKVLPKLAQGEKLEIVKLEELSHETQAPARFTEGSLIKELERLGIGRPSTWASIVDLVLQRSYAFKRGTALVPTFLAIAVVSLMEKNFTNLTDYAFTARLEDDLDAISRGEHDNQAYLKTFYFGNGHPGLKTLVEVGEKTIDPRIVCGIPVGVASTGEQLEVRIGRYGPFLSNGELRAGLPEGLAPDEMTLEKAAELLAAAARGPESLGNHPETNEPIYIKTGRFGPYVQMGVMKDDVKPRMASLLPGMLPQDVTFEVALKLLQFPKNVGKHPELNDDVVVANGRYGPYVKCGAETRSIPTDEVSLLDVDLAKAIEILKLPKRMGRTSQPKSLRDIGVHPVSEKKIQLKAGRYGPYVTDGEINASLARDADPNTLTLEDAVNLLSARAAKVAEGGGPRRKRASKPKQAATPKAPKKKSAKKTKAKTKSEPEGE